MHDLIDRPHSYREFEPEEFKEAWEDAESGREEGQVRAALKRVEDGRFNEMLDATHKMLCALDRDEVEMFYEEHPNLMGWVNVFADVMELRDFREYAPEGES